VSAQPHVYAKDIALLQLPLPPLPEQRRIAAILDQADALRAKRREALAQLDSLTQSIFIEMFGDPETNEKGLPLEMLGTMCKRITDGTHLSPKWDTSGVPFLFISNIVDGQITFNTHKFISNETYTELTRRCPIELGDVLYTTVGSYGNAAVVETTKQFAFQRHIAHIKPDKAKIVPLFLAAMIQSTGVRRQVDKVAKGVAQKTVNLADLKNLLVFAPAHTDQQDFANCVQSVEALKVTHRAALQELDRLFASLQHRAFQGEL
jgi:type I restriction enzyme S subunit